MHFFRRILQGAVFVIFLLLASVGQSVAQFGNEWISAGQPYFKIPVARTGLYRLTAEALVAAGVPGGTDPNSLQLYHRGVEHAIRVDGGADGTLDPGDYIEFFGQQNDGELDATLYSPQSAQPHKYYNLYSDTTAYFLTVASTTGKRITQFSQSPGALSPEPSHTDEKLIVNTSQYSTGLDQHEIEYSTFDPGEGWTGNQILQGQTIDYTLSGISGAVTADGPPLLEVLLVGRGLMAHQGDILVGNAQRQAGSFTFEGYSAHTAAVTLQWSDVAPDGTLPVRVRCNGVAGGVDRVSVSYLKVRYPQLLDMQSAAEKVFELTGGKPLTFANISNAPSGTRLFDITDPANVVAIGATAATTLRAVVPSATPRKIFATSMFSTPLIRTVAFRDIQPGVYDYIIVGHPSLRTPALGYADPVAAYAGYRESEEGGAYRTLVVNSNELYDQFNYGEYSPRAIFQFVRYLAGSAAPKYLLLAGKGLEVYYNWNRNQGSSSFGSYRDFVPSAGYPGSDMAFSAGLSGTPHVPAIPTGRIPAVRSEDIAAYLNKVKEMEALGYTKLWRKNLMHLSGGIYEGEPQLFKSYMEEFQRTAEGEYLGGKVSALAKHSKELQMINIAAQVNQGVSMVNFFGHASPTLTDFELGYVTDPLQGYNNKGKYPTLLMNGCQVGAFFLPSTLFGEDWVVAKDKGAIGFIGHSAYGFSSTLKRYAELFYEVGYADNEFIRRGIGDIQKETARRYLATDGVTYYNVSQVQQMVLLGDPAVKLFGATKPDLEITDADISITSFDGQPITMQMDSFAVRVIVRNYGLAPEATVRIEAVRTLNDNTTLSYDSLYPLTKYSDTLTLVIRKRSWETAGFGDNAFRVTIDPDGVIDEYDKGNNVAGKSIAIALNGTRNVYPVNFAIVNDPSLNLAVQTTDLMSAEREFLVELDTAYDFSSTFKKQWTVKGEVLARQEISLAEGDSTTYYWRTRLAMVQPGESDAWTQSSFTFIKDGPEGWTQMQFPQYLGNPAVGLVKDSVLRQLRFQESVTPVSVTALSSQVPDYYWQTHVNISGVDYFRGFSGFECRSNTLNLVAFDRKSAVPYLGVKLEWFNRGGRTCGREAMVINSYAYTEMATDGEFDLVGYVNNIPTGDSVVLFTVGNAYYSLWPQSAKTKLGEFGISEAQINQLQDNEPVIIFGRKGDAPGTAQVLRSESSDHSQQIITATRTITGGFSSGRMRTELIGPATEWKELIARPVLKEESDQVSFDVSGVKTNGAEHLLFSAATGSQDLSTIDASEYSHLRLAFNVTDETYITPAQLAHWLVSYTPGPEGLLMYAGTRQTEELPAGMDWVGRYGFINISDKDFPDSLTVSFDVFNQSNLTTTKRSIRIKAPAPGDTTYFSIRMPTQGLAGHNDVQVFVNPRLVPEQYYDNNLLLLADKFVVTEDGVNPVLDVTFDGRQVLNGDYVSPEPVIRVQIWDENSYVLKQDTSGVRLFLTSPCTGDNCRPEQILLSDSRIQWTPATTSAPFTVTFRPRLADGEYRLRVEGADAHGNGSNLQPYEVSFVVKGETTLEVSGPYPNPTTADVNFKLVLTGSVVPDQVDLQVVGLNGQLLATLTQADLPPLRVGTNELVWDGYVNGQRLPNGVYVYRLRVAVGTTLVERKGKLVLVR